MHMIDLSGQSIDNLKSQRSRIEREITKLSSLITESEKDKNASVQQLKLYEKKISQTNSLLQSYGSELNHLKNTMDYNRKTIDDLQLQKQNLLDFYGKAIYEHWKLKNKNLELLYILSSTSFNQAYRRYRYFKDSKDFVRTRLEEIDKINDSLIILNKKNELLITKISQLKNKVDDQNRVLLKDKSKELSLLSGIRKNESSLRAKLNKEISNRKRLDLKIKELISAQVKKSGSTISNTIRMNSVETDLAKDFSSNKGKLPWPVSNGVITERFGVHNDVVHKYVQVSNDGISISAKKNAEVWSVFNGVVTSIIHITGLNNVVLVRHGNYFTLYGNLSDVSVMTGQTVSTGQLLGKLSYNSDKGSVLQFQIWKNLEKLNPQYWLSK